MLGKLQLFDCLDCILLLLEKLTTTCRTAIGIKLKDGIILAVEKLVTSKLLVPGANKRIATVDTHAGIVSPPNNCRGGW